MLHASWGSGLTRGWGGIIQMQIVKMLIMSDVGGTTQVVIVFYLIFYFVEGLMIVFFSSSIE